MSVYGKFLNPSDNLDDIFQIIDKVFINDKKNSNLDTIINKNSLNVVIYSSNEDCKVVATGCLSKVNNIFTISNVIVLEEEKSKGYDELAVRMLANKAFISGANEIYINVPVKSVPLYNKIGFTAIQDSNSNKEFYYIKMKLYNENFYNQCDKKH